MHAQENITQSYKACNTGAGTLAFKHREKKRISFTAIYVFIEITKWIVFVTRTDYYELIYPNDLWRIFLKIQ